MDLKDLLHLVPFAMVQVDQSEELAARAEKSIVAKLVVPLLPPLLAIAVLIGGMKWAISSLERQLDRHEVVTASATAALLERIKTLEERQIRNIERIAVLEAQMAARQRRP